jgi:FkbM family methyltransferase
MSIFLSALKKNGHLDNIQMTICNIGSRKVSVDDDYGSKDWKYFAPSLTIYGFDADEDACEQAQAELKARRVNWTEKHFPLVFSNTLGTSELYVTQDLRCTSLYPPNEMYLSRFAKLADMFRLDYTIEVPVTTLDAFCESETLQEVDFLQIDVQGANLQVLQGAKDLLNRSVLAVQVEVEFAPLYINQPLFNDIDKCLKEWKFTLFDLVASYVPRADSPLMSRQRPGQLLWGEAFYLRDLLADHQSFLEKTPKQLLKLACIADILDFSDYALEILQYITLTYGNEPAYNLAGSIVESLAQFPDLIHAGLSSLSIVQDLQKYLTSFNLDDLQLNSSTSQLNQTTPIAEFHSAMYQRHNQRRLEHLASLNLNLANKTVLEVGAGIGDHTSFFLDRGCQVTVTEGRLENLDLIKARYPGLSAHFLDMDNPDLEMNTIFDIVYCYGLLYHLRNPIEAIVFMAARCQNILLLETCVSYGEEEVLNPCREKASVPSQAISGWGCRPTRSWIYNQLKQHFEFIYLPVTQPNHEEFPIDWLTPPQEEKLTRSVFIASRTRLDNPLLVEQIPMQQRKY